MKEEMQELYAEGVATHGGPEPCVGSRKDAGEALAGVRAGWAIDVRIGAIYSLEQIARDSAELHWPVMEVLAVYLRKYARWGSSGDRVRRGYCCDLV